jgi:hypothetical protein
MAEDIVSWWGDKTLAEVKGETCREYVKWRTSQPIRRFTKNVSRKNDFTGDRPARAVRAEGGDPSLQ